MDTPGNYKWFCVIMVFEGYKCVLFLAAAEVIN